MSSPYLSDIRSGIVDLAVQAANEAADAAAQAVTFATYQEDLSQQLVIFGLVRELADAFDAPRQLVFAIIWNAPVEMVELIDTPHGWTALGLYVGGELGIRDPHFFPTVH